MNRSTHPTYCRLLLRTDETRHLDDGHQSGNVIWGTVLTVAAIGGWLVLPCVMPFAALAVALAGTLCPSMAIATILVIWLANQAVGFGLLGYPRTANTILWGGAIGLAAVLSVAIAYLTLDRPTSWAKVPRLLLALCATFAVYELALFAAAPLLGGLDTFTTGIIAQLALTNILWFAALLILNEGTGALVRRWAQARSGLARAS